MAAPVRIEGGKEQSPNKSVYVRRISDIALHRKPERLTEQYLLNPSSESIEAHC